MAIDLGVDSNLTRLKNMSRARVGWAAELKSLLSTMLSSTTTPFGSAARVDIALSGAAPVPGDAGKLFTVSDIPQRLSPASQTRAGLVQFGAGKTVATPRDVRAYIDTITVPRDRLIQLTSNLISNVYSVPAQAGFALTPATIKSNIKGYLWVNWTIVVAVNAVLPVPRSSSPSNFIITYNDSYSGVNPYSGLGFSYSYNLFWVPITGAPRLILRHIAPAGEKSTSVYAGNLNWIQNSVDGHLRIPVAGVVTPAALWSWFFPRSTRATNHIKPKFARLKPRATKSVNSKYAYAMREIDHIYHYDGFTDIYINLYDSTGGG